MDHTNKEKSYSGDESDSDESLSLDLLLNCEICDKTFSSFKSFLQHEKSSRHYKKLSQKKLEKKLSKNPDDDLSSGIDDLTVYQKVFAECDACKKIFSGPESYYQHLKSKIHRKKTARAKLLEQVTQEGKVDVEKLKDIYKQNTVPQDTLMEVGASGYSPTFEDTGSEDDVLAETHQFQCADCGKAFTGIDPWHQHLVSKTHEKTVKQKKLLVRVTSGALSKSPKDSEVASLPAGDLLDAIEVDGDVLVCRLCHKSFSGPESAVAHLKSKGHAKKKELRELKIKFAAKSSHKIKARDFRNENQAPEGPASTHDFKRSEPLISNDIVNDIATDKDSGNPTPADHSEFKEKSHIKKTKAQEFRNENQGPESSNYFEESEPMDSNVIINDIATDKDSDNPTQANHSELKGKSHIKKTSKDAAVETENLSNSIKDNALLCYEKYKNYKKIMNEIEAEKTEIEAEKTD